MRILSLINSVRASLSSKFQANAQESTQTQNLTYDQIVGFSHNFEAALQQANIKFEISEGYNLVNNQAAYTIDFTPHNPRFGGKEVSIWIYESGDVEFTGQILTNKELQNNALAARSEYQTLKQSHGDKNTTFKAACQVQNALGELYNPVEVTRPVTTGNTIEEKLDYIRNYLLIPALKPALEHSNTLEA